MAPAANNPAARKYHGIRAIVVLLVKHRTIWKICIGILNHLFFWPEQYRRTGRMSIVFLFDENPDVASAGSGGAAVDGARSVPDHAARSNSKRAAPSARVGNRFSAPQIVWNKSNRCAGERNGARVGRPRWARILTITGGSSMAACRAYGDASAGVALTRPRATELVPAYCLSKTRISSSYRVWLPSVPVCLLVSVFPSAETVIRPPELTRPSGTYSFTVPSGRL